MLRICLSRPLKSRKRVREYRIVVKDSRFHVTSNRFVEKIGHIKLDKDDQMDLDKERLLYWYGIGAQPTERIVSLAKKVGVVLPARKGAKENKIEKKAVNGNKKTVNKSK